VEHENAEKGGANKLGVFKGKVKEDTNNNWGRRRLGRILHSREGGSQKKDEGPHQNSKKKKRNVTGASFQIFMMGKK